MLGIAIAVIVAVWVTVFGGNTMEAGFLSGVGFLWVWYWIWTIVLGFIVALVMLGVTGALTFLGSEETQSKLGGFLGFAVGGTLSILVIAHFAMTRALLPIGTYLLMTAGMPGMTFAEFSTSKLIFGTLLLLIGLVMSKNSSSSPSS